MPKYSSDPMVKQFLMYLEIEKGVSQNTIKGYSHDLELLSRFLVNQEIVDSPKNIDWKSLNIFTLRSFLGVLHEKHNKSSSIHRRVCTMKGFFKFLDENNIISDDPAKDLSYPKRAKSLPKFLPQSEMLKLLNVKKSSLLHQTIIEVLYSTGARVNELRNMSFDDVEFEEETVLVDGKKVSRIKGKIMIRGGKGSKDRIVLITPRASQSLKKYINTERKDTLERVKSRGNAIPEDSQKALFISNRGIRISNRAIQHFVSKASEDAGIRHTTPHMIRHSFASHLAMANTNIRAIQQLLGHSSLDTTQIYANISPDFLRREFEGNLPIS